MVNVNLDLGIIALKDLLYVKEDADNREQKIIESEERTANLLRSFSCEKNQTLQEFIHNKAIENNNRNWGRTYLVYIQPTWEDAPIYLAGYFTLTQKSFQFESDVSPTTRKKVAGKKDAQHFPTTLIANIAKNEKPFPETKETYSSNPLKGSDLLTAALRHCEKGKDIFGTRLVCLEYMDNEYLEHFYTTNGFRTIQINSGNNLTLAFKNI